MFCIKVDVTDDETGQTLSGAWHTCADISSPGVVPVGLPPPAPPSAPFATAAPTISRLKETAKAWREASALADVNAEGNRKKLPLGTTFSFDLNERASVTLTFIRTLKGHKAGTTCVVQTRTRTGARCTRTVFADTLTFSAHAGTNKVRFEGLGAEHKKLRPGSYTLLITATSEAGERAHPKTLNFTIVE